MRRCLTHALRTGLALCGLILMSSSLQAGARTAVYVTKTTCQMDSLLSAGECQNAFANAEAEFNDSAPVFATQAECEQQFRRCVISFSELPRSSTALRYAPKLRGVQVTVNSEQDRTVLPVLDGSHPAVSFGRRTVLSLQDFRSPLNQQDAQTRWVAFQHQSLAPTLIDWCKRYCVAFSGGGTPTSAPAQSSLGLFSPSVEDGPQSYAALETHHFRQSDPPVPPGQSRFIQRAETLMRNLTANKEVDSRAFMNYASIPSRSPWPRARVARGWRAVVSP